LFNPNLIVVLWQFDSTYSDLSYVVVVAVVSEALILQEFDARDVFSEFVV